MGMEEVSKTSENCVETISDYFFAVQVTKNRL